MRKRVSLSKKAVMALSAVVSAGLVGAVVVGMSTAAPAAGVLGDPTTVSYSSTTNPPTVEIPSVSPEGSSFAELGNEVTLANPGPLSSVIVSMSSWACGSGTWWVGNCETTPGATFPVPITLTIYSAGQGNAPGPQIATETGTFNIPFRPSKSTECQHSMPGGWYEATNHTCHDSFTYNITFSNFTPPDQSLPGTVVYGIAYNTSHNGYHPLGATCALTHGGQCPADSLNIGLSQNVTAGANAVEDHLFIATPRTVVTCATTETGSPLPFRSYNVVERGTNDYGDACGWGVYYFPAVIINTTTPGETTTTTTTTTVPTTTTTAPTTTTSPTTAPPGPTTTSPPTTSPPTTTPPAPLPPFPHAGVSYPNAAIVTFGANHYVFAGGRAFPASASELAAVQKVDPAQVVAAPSGPAPAPVVPRPGVTVFTQPVNGNVTIYVIGLDGRLHPFATPTQFLHDGYNPALVITVPNLGGLTVGSNAGTTLTALVTMADGAIVNSSGTFYTFAGGRAFGISTPAALLEIRKTNSAVELQGSVSSADTGDPIADGVVLSVVGPVYVSYLGELYPFKTTTQLVNYGYGGTPAVPPSHTGGLTVVFPYSQALSLRASPIS
jgi:hypothetical protein